MSAQEKDRAKAQQEKFQAILSLMLKDEDNKYCVDCDTKGPRWASWNLGVFLCIRCAGIHRNLGVHISRVKSVNLDSWTAEQVAMMQEMGNSRARAVYEANVPDKFTRPQTNTAVEAFIRSKYETKKYIAREWVPHKPVVPKEWLEVDKADKKRPRSNFTKSASSISYSNGPSSSQSAVSSSASSESRTSVSKSTAATTPAPSKSMPRPHPGKTTDAASNDLLSLDAEGTQQNKAASGGQGDLLADLLGSSPTSFPEQGVASHSSPGATQQNGFVEPNFFDSGSAPSSEGQGEKKSTKDSIMALYGSGGVQQQMFGVPGGMYMPQQGMYGSGGVPGMMPQQVVMMGMQPTMMGQPMSHAMAPGMVYGGVGQMAGGMMGGGGLQGGVMNRAGGAMFMQQPTQQAMPQQLTPMQQQFQLQQMQQQMASMSLAGSQMRGVQQPQQATVGGGCWGANPTGQTLSSSLWQ